MLNERRVARWLALAAILLLVIGTLSFQRISRRSQDARSGRALDSVGASQVVVVATSTLAMLSVLIAAWQMRSEARHRQRVELRLQDALASVEHQVADRTQELSKAMADLTVSEQQFRLITDQLHLALDEKAAALARADEARRAAEEASRLKDEFLATASHELRTPLNAIVGWVHVLQSGAVVDEVQRQHAVSAIDRNAKFQTRLIEDLLDVSRMIQGRLSLATAPIDMRSVVAAAVETIQPAASAREISVHVVSPFEAVPIMADAARLQQVVWNLLSNAVKFTPRGGAVTVSLSAVKDRAELVVADTGEGIGADFLPHIFEPFRQGASTTMRSGMGLGLAIVQRLVDLHGGRVTAASRGPGAGAEFAVSLPLAPASVLVKGPGSGLEPARTGQV